MVGFLHRDQAMHLRRQGLGRPGPGLGCGVEAIGCPWRDTEAVPRRSGLWVPGLAPRPNSALILAMGDKQTRAYNLQPS